MNLRLLGEQQECYPCAMQPPTSFFKTRKKSYLDVDAAGTALDTEEIGHAGSTNS